jgi:hypothetical protein
VTTGLVEPVVKCLTGPPYALNLNWTTRDIGILEFLNLLCTSSSVAIINHNSKEIDSRKLTQFFLF